MENNNNISAFEKVVFVDKINNEYDAEQLSKEYPFAYIVTEKTSEGLEDGIQVDSDDNIIPGQEYNGQIIKPNSSSGNIWKGGQRLTKFINVDSSKNTVQFDAFNLTINFNQASGLLSFIKIPKIDDYKIVSVFYKYNNVEDEDNHFIDVKTYINKQLLRDDRDNGIIPEYLSSTNLSDAEFLDFLNTYDDIIINDSNDSQSNESLKSVRLQNFGSEQGIINSLDNKIYLVLRFEAASETTLNSVSNSSFNIGSYVDNALKTSKNAYLLNVNNHLTEFTNIIDTNQIEKIAKVTYNYKYLTSAYNSGLAKPGRYYIYELEIGEKSDDRRELGFYFENASNLPEFKISADKLIINPTSYNLIINGNTIDLDNDNLTTYVMPGTTVNCRLELYPSKLSDFALQVTSNRNNTSDFTFGDNQSSLTVYPQKDQYGNNNKFTFTINSTDLYDFDSESLEQALENTSKTLLSFELKQYNETEHTISNDIYWVEHTNIQKYNWCDWSIRTIENGNSPFGGLVSTEAKSGAQISFSPGRIYAIFNEPGSTNEDTQQLLDITTSTQISWHFEPGDQYVDEENGILFNNNAEYVNNDPTSVGLPESKYFNRYDEVINFAVPFIFRSSEGAIFYCEYIHKNHHKRGDRIHINPDTISNITITGGITFNDINNTAREVNNIESGASVEIKTKYSQDFPNNYIKFNYQTAGTINANKYLYKTLTSLKRDIKIGLSGSLLDENDNDKENANGVKYVTISNDKLIYNSDDARSSKNTISLKLSYYDPNFRRTINSEDTVDLIVNKLLIDYWIYIGEIYKIKYNDSTGDVEDFWAVIPDIPEESTTDSEPHIVANYTDIPALDLRWAGRCYCGVLYQYADINHPEYSDIKSEEVINDNELYRAPLRDTLPNNTFVREKSFGTWIHLGTEDKLNQLNLPGNSNSMVFGGSTDDKLYAGNKDYLIMLVPDILTPAGGSGYAHGWSWGNVPQPQYVFKKGLYKGYVFENSAVNVYTHTNENQETETLSWGEGYADLIIRS